MDKKYENIDLNLDEISALNINDSKRKEQGYKDKNVSVRTSSGQEVKTSNIILGKQDVTLTNGIYLSLDEVISALDSYLTNKTEKENKEIISKRTNKKVTKKEVMDKIQNIFQKGINTGKIRLNGRTEKFSKTNHQTFNLKGKNETSYAHNGVFLFKKGIYLSNGEYVEKKEIENALNKYLLADKISQKKQFNPITHSN